VGAKEDGAGSAVVYRRDGTAWIEEQRLMPQMTVAHALVHAENPRPCSEIPGLRGAYLAGDWVGERGMLADAAVSSARWAATEILARGGERKAA